MMKSCAWTIVALLVASELALAAPGRGGGGGGGYGGGRGYGGYGGGYGGYSGYGRGYGGFGVGIGYGTGYGGYGGYGYGRPGYYSGGYGGYGGYGYGPRSYIGGTSYYYANPVVVAPVAPAYTPEMTAAPSGQPGLVVEKVADGSIAQKAGLKPGDFVAKINGVDVPNEAALKSALGQTKEGKLEFYALDGRTGQWQTLSAAGYTDRVGMDYTERMLMK